MTSRQSFDFRGLEIFLAICEAGDQTSAARQLDLTQAAVSQHLAKLERDLGVPLINRTMRPAQLTPAGLHLRGRALSLFRDISELRDMLLRYRDCDILELKLGIIESIADAVVPHLVTRLDGKVGDLSISSSTSNSLIPELMNGEIDMIVTSEILDDLPDLAIQPLLTEPFVLVLPPGHSAPKSWSDVNDLAQSLNLVRYTRHRRMSRAVAHVFERFGINIHGSLHFDTTNALLDTVRHGQGWGVTTPISIAAAGVKRDDITIAPFPSNAPIRCVQLAWRIDRETPAFRTVLGIFRDIIENVLMSEMRQNWPDIPTIHMADQQAA
jgi:DNA-binding transcriptional LysR family regulator